MDEDQILFHPIGEPQETKGHPNTHIQRHYKKHLFGLGLLVGLAMFQILSILGSSLGITKTTGATNADYKPSAIETALKTFDQIEKIARQKDKFFHQEGKIYSYTGTAIFQKLDNMFHIVDNAYRSATNMEKKLKLAEKLNVIIDEQNALFQATQNINPDRDIALRELDETFHQLQKHIQSK